MNEKRNYTSLITMVDHTKAFHFKFEDLLFFKTSRNLGGIQFGNMKELIQYL